MRRIDTDKTTLPPLPASTEERAGNLIGRSLGGSPFALDVACPGSIRVAATGRGTHMRTYQKHTTPSRMSPLPRITLLASLQRRPAGQKLSLLLYGNLSARH
jgi:hypothetical protein